MKYQEIGPGKLIYQISESNYGRGKRVALCFVLIQK